MGSVLDNSFEADSATQLRDVYLANSFKECDENVAKAFFGLIDRTTLCKSEDERHVNQEMRKCFPYNSSIDFEKTEQKEDLWDQAARELWQTGYTQWQHNLASLQGDSKFNFFSRLCLFVDTHFPLFISRFQERRHEPEYWRVKVRVPLLLAQFYALLQLHASSLGWR